MKENWRVKEINVPFVMFSMVTSNSLDKRVFFFLGKMYFRNSPKVSWFSLRIIVTKLTRVQSSWKVDPPPLPSLTGLFSLGNYKPSVTCCTTKFILDFFVPMTLLATHSYKPLSVGLKFLMVRSPWFTSVFPAGKGIPNLVHFTTGGGKPSA